MKKILCSIVSLLMVWGLMAAPIGEQQARKIAADFFAAGGRSMSGLSLVYAGDALPAQGGRSTNSMNSENPMFYIYNRGTTGFAIVAGDDVMSESILAYSQERAFDVNNMAPATRAIIDAWGKQVEAARNGNAQARQVAYAAGDEKLYTTALWNQFEPFNNEAPVYDGMRSVTGCVATAMSIIAYYHKWPEKGVGTTPAYNYQDFNDGTVRSIPANTLGRTYDYANMLSDYNHGWTTAQGDAVAALMKDMGTSVQMAYNPAEWTGSGAASSDVPAALATYFGYSKRALFINQGGNSAEEWQTMVRENIKTYGPTFFSGRSGTGGHAFVLDGYNAEGYFRINYGWGGSGYGFYYLPNIEYYAYQGAIFYLEPDRSGTSTYQDYLTLVTLYSNNQPFFTGLKTTATEFKVGEEFQLLVGGYQNAGATTFDGEIQLAVCDKQGNIKQSILNESCQMSVGEFDYYKSYVSYTPTALAEGDRMRVLYKGQYSDGQWQWAKSSEATAVSEIILKASPAEVAEALDMTYSKSQQTISFSAMNMPLQITITDSQAATVDSQSVAMMAEATFDVSGFEGEYTFSIASGGEPYQLVLQF